MKRANYICTINNSNSNVGKIERLIYKGMAVARINASHVDHAKLSEMLGKIERARDRYNERTRYYCNLATALDLRGPEIRIRKVGKKFGDEFKVKVDDKLMFSIDVSHADRTPDDILYVPCQNILDFLKSNHTVLVNHGQIELKVIEIIGYTFTCTVISAKSTLKVNQDIQIPEIYQQLNLKPVTDDDISDIKFGVENNIDFIIASNIECGLVIDEIRAHADSLAKKRYEIFL
jgi:pyruvate kinase